MGAEHFCLLDQAREPVDARRRLARLAGECLELCDWEVAPGVPETTALGRYAESFVVPLAGTLALTDAGAAADNAAGSGDDRVAPLEHGSIAYWSATRGPAAVRGAACRYLVVGWPHAA